MPWCKWTTLESGKVYCETCDPNKSHTQKRATRRWCGPLPPSANRQQQDQGDPIRVPRQTPGPQGEVKVGTELTRILKKWSRALKWVTLGKVDLEYRPGCKCKDRARLMDERGPEWCEKHIEEVTGWLEEEAIRRKLPFSREVGQRLIRQAIRNSRKRANREARKQAEEAAKKRAK